MDATGFGEMRLQTAPSPQVRQAVALRSSAAPAREVTVNMASEIYKEDADNQIQTSKILREVRSLQAPEDLEKELVAVESAISAQVCVN